jgi:hypothetical protein
MAKPIKNPKPNIERISPPAHNPLIEIVKFIRKAIKNKIKT